MTDSISNKVWLILGVIAVFAVGSCKKNSTHAPDDAGAGACVPVANTGLCWRKPAVWTFSLETAALEQPVSARTFPLEDSGAPPDAGSHLGASIKIAQGQRQTRGPSIHPPRFEIYLSTDLPQGSSATDFLAANRRSQQLALGKIAIRHLEVEPVRRSGRRGYHVRDAFDVPLPQGGAAPVSQQALLLVDGSRGFVIVVSLLEDDLPRYRNEINRWLQSIAFVGTAPP